jgi:FHS family glucose/mannose:H+ symporter-like MFS transporter
MQDSMHVAPEIPPLATAKTPPGGPGTGVSEGPRKALAGFFVSGILLGFLGAIVPAWGHHLQPEYWMVGLYFVALILGVLASVRLARRLMEKLGLARTLSLACALASLALFDLAFFSPPYIGWWRLPAILILGTAAGLLHTAIFHAISPMYRQDPAATVNLGGILFGLGCFSVALLISRTFYFYTAAAIQIWIALIPAFFALVYARTNFAPQKPSTEPHAGAVLAEIKSPGAVLFSLVLFFQFGNEWAIAGWLPLFLSQRLGMSPADSVLILALYWMALLVGRLVAQWMLPLVRHTRLLVGSVLMAMFACTILLDTNNSFGAVSGVLLLGAAFAPIYPLVVEKIGHRFPYYHPGFYNGIFSFAMVGGLLAPSMLGYFVWLLDVRAVMELPLVGSMIVFVLLALIWLEARLSATLHPGV